MNETTNESRNLVSTTITFQLENTTGKPEARLIQVVEKVPDGKCPVDGCLEGKYATKHHDCEGRGCEECSNVEDHGITGRVLCKYCGGKKCEACEFTGLFLKPCRMCNGTGSKLRSVQVSKIRRVVIRPAETDTTEDAEIPPERVEKPLKATRHKNMAFGTVADNDALVAVLDAISFAPAEEQSEVEVAATSL